MPELFARNQGLRSPGPQRPEGEPKRRNRSARLRGVFACALIGLSLQAEPVLAQDAGVFFKGVQAFRERQFDAAVSYFEQAAEQGDSDAQFLLGRMHYDGNSLPVDYVAAYQWFAIAAENGLAVALRYRDGLGRKMTEAEVTEGARRAAEWVSRHRVARETQSN